MKTLPFSRSLDRFPSDLDANYEQDKAYDCPCCQAQTWTSSKAECEHCGKDACDECVEEGLCERCRKDAL